MTADLPDAPAVAPSSRLWWTVPVVGVLLMLTIASLIGRGPEKVDFGTSYDASGRGFRAAYLLLESLGYPVERSRRPAGGEIRWVLFPKEPAKSAAELEAWVSRGGVALLALDSQPYARAFGLDVAITGGTKDGPRAPAPAAPEPLPASAPDVEKLAAGPLTVDDPDAPRDWGELDGWPVATIHPHGRGEVWILRRPDVLTNARLRQADNAVLVARLADAMRAGRPNAAISFDEFAHGLRDRPDFAELLFRPPALYATLQALALAALAVWHYGPRFGPLRPEPPPARRSKEEFLDAMADLLHRKGDRADAYRTARDDARHRLEASLGLPAGTPADELARQAERRRSIASEPLARALAADAPPGRGGAALLTALHQLEAATHDPARTGR